MVRLQRQLPGRYHFYTSNLLSTDLLYCIAMFAGDPAGEDGEDGEVDLNTLDDSGFELQLPSGTRVGHRSLLR